MILTGDAYGVRMNGHRHGWAGRICKDAANWDCGARRDFRENYCAMGDERCFHIHVFDEHQPQFLIDDNSAQWLLDPDGRALENQLLLFWGKRFKEPRGISPTTPGDMVLYGGYRVQYVTRQRINSFGREAWLVEPYEDGWFRLPVGPIKSPAFYHLDGQYFKGIPQSRMIHTFNEIETDLSRGMRRDWSDVDQQRFRHFHAHLEQWMQEARDTAEALMAERGETEPHQAGTQAAHADSQDDLTDDRFSSLRKIISIVPKETGKAAESAPQSNKEAPTPSAPQPEKRALLLPEPGVSTVIERIYGRNTLRALRVAFNTKHMVILTGSPGTGKSRLASYLLDDPDSDRTLIVPVASTWRGRDELLGYVNPVSAEFEPTAFTEFLIASEKAWDEGDRRPRLVVFEEFNLSQPEHWLSDILVRSEYAAESRASRSLDLGGKAVRGYPGRPSRVFLSPAVHFVATINNDHTVRPLSPRVIDRASVMEVQCEAREALKRLGVPLEEEKVLAIEQLSMILESKGIGFSVRSARSLRQNLAARDLLDMTDWEVIDFVLLQEVLSKVRLLAGDPRDEEVVGKLQEWAEQDYCKALNGCSTRINNWAERIGNSRDVIQV